MEGQAKESVLHENLPSYMIKNLTDKVTPLHEAANRDIRLLDAALEGEVTLLNDLLLEDPHILDRNRCIAQYGGSPLHVSANAGHIGFVQMILQHKPDLAEELDQSKRWLPLHMASSKGHLEIVNLLLEANPKMPVILMVAVHISAIYGHTGVLAVVLRAKPQVALELTNAGETVFHLCVKHNRPEALKYLIAFTDNDKVLNSKDNGDNTILHLAVAAKQHVVVDILLETKMDKNDINRNGFTAMDLCSRSTKEKVDIKIWKSLKRAKASRRKDTVNRHRDWLEKQRNALMVVASLIATMAFQTGVNPPGGVWQEDDGTTHKAGKSIMQAMDFVRYNRMVIYNTVGLFSSLFVILLLISGLPCKRLSVSVLMITMWIAVIATASTYTISLIFQANIGDLLFMTKTDQNNYTNANKYKPVTKVVNISLGTWIIFLVILVLAHFMRTIIKLVKEMVQSAINIWDTSNGRSTRPPPV